MRVVNEPARHLAIVLSLNRKPERIELSEEEAGAPCLRVAGQNFQDSGSGDWLGFCDRLLDAHGKMIGVRQWIDEFSHLVFIKGFMGVEIDLTHRVVQIFFGDSRDVDEQNSASQDFGSNRLLVDGESVALTFYFS